MCKTLERNGWQLARTKSSHHIYKKPGYLPITVPAHGNKSLKPGTQHDIMKQAVLTEDDL
jgi:predicted RNA binding protein YcfA (HicA-like mRNA interferase family)